MIWELSTPFVHLRWFLIKAGEAKSRLYLINGLALVVVFFACRPVWGTWLSYKVSGCWLLHHAWLSCCACVVSLNTVMIKQCARVASQWQQHNTRQPAAIYLLAVTA